MGEIWARIGSAEHGPIVGQGDASQAVEEIVSRLEAGSDFAQLLATTKLEPADILAAVGFDALNPTEPDRPQLTQDRPRRRDLAKAFSERSLSTLLPKTTKVARLALAAGLLQIHDFWDASHEAAQQADDQGERAVSAYWHGIAHRREPDAGNASYWFRRVGRHAIFPELARAAGPVLEAHGDGSLTARLVSGGAWNPFAFIDLCADGNPAARHVRLALDLQRLEMRLLLEASIEAALARL